MRFRAFPAPRAYWLDGAELRLTDPADGVKGAPAWDYSTVTASAAAYRTFLAEAVAAGLPQATADRILAELGAA